MATRAFMYFYVIILITVNLNGIIMYNGGIYTEHTQRNTFLQNINQDKPVNSYETHKYIVQQYYNKRKYWKTSKLGSLLFKNLNLKPFTNQNNKTFLILIWKYWGWLRNRHVYQFGVATSDPLYDCSVNNCRFTGDDKYLNTADVVLVHIQKGLLPKVKHRNVHQRWVFLSDEAPPNTYTLTAKDKPNFSSLSNIFNWSMTYRSDADIPVPYGRTLPLTKPMHSEPSYQNVSQLVPYWKIKKRDTLITILISHCTMARRMEYLKRLKNYINIDIHGKCSSNIKLKNSCPGHFRTDCPVITKYLFYLVLENAKCRQYTTEKLFYNAYTKGAIPIIWGTPIIDCEKLLPPNSFLHVDDFASPRDLAKEIENISKSDGRLLSYHMWRNNFRISNEHGYFGSKSYHLCRICEALNYNDNTEKVYDSDEMRLFLDKKISCTY